MNFRHLSLIYLVLVCTLGIAQNPIPLDTTNFKIQSRSHVFETFKGQEAIYLQGGSLSLKDVKFLNGTIEYDIYLKEEQAFPSVYFRVNDGDAEQWYIRPHLPGKPDANQAIPVTNGLSSWQLYFGPKYSFPYTYKYDEWTHVKIVVNNDKAQVYLDHSKEPQLSWRLFHKPKAGDVVFTGGNRSGMHLANIRVDQSKFGLKDFSPVARTPMKNLIQTWEISDKFEEKLLDNPSKLTKVITARKWIGKIEVEEGTAANIARRIQLRDKTPGNTVFAKVTITTQQAITKKLDFGYSDRTVVILNGKPIYRGTNGYRTRDYRYLGTVGLFDSVYLNLNKGKNTLLLAVSEDFGGWLVTGKIEDQNGIKIVP